MRECTPAQSQQMQAARLNMRMQREIKLLQTEPPPGVCAWPSDHHLITRLEAQIEGAEGTVYAKGIFKLQIQVPDRYPFDPPNVRFVTPIYHPNIDNGGRICLDILNLPPKGAWRPSLNIATVLASIGLLLSEPNPDDGLMGDISSEYKHNRSIFDRKARLWTQKYAVQTECQTNSLTTDTSRPGGSLQIGQGSNEILGTLEQMKETAKKVATEVKNQANIEWELKEKGHVNPAKSTLPLSRKLSLTREPLVQPTKGSSPEEMVTQAKEQFYNGNLDLQSAQNTVTEASQKLSISSVLGEKMHQKVGIDDSASRIHNAFKGVGGGEEEDVCRDKENLQPRCWNAEIPPPNLSALKGLESDPGTCLSMNGMKRRQNTQKLLLHNNTSVHSNQNTTSLTTNQGTKRHDELVNAHPLKSKTHEFPISRPHQPEENNVKENTNGRVHVRTLKDVPTIIVSDSESDEEPAQVRSRLSLLQRKRKATYNG